MVNYCVQRLLQHSLFVIEVLSTPPLPPYMACSKEYTQHSDFYSHSEKVAGELWTKDP